MKESNVSTMSQGHGLRLPILMNFVPLLQKGLKFLCFFVVNYFGFSKASIHRLLYIRGTPQQTIAALRVVQRKVGGRLLRDEECETPTSGFEGVLIPLEALLFVVSKCLQLQTSHNDVSSCSSSPFTSSVCSSISAGCGFDFHLPNRDRDTPDLPEDELSDATVNTTFESLASLHSSHHIPPSAAATTELLKALSNVFIYGKRSVPKQDRTLLILCSRFCRMQGVLRASVGSLCDERVCDCLWRLWKPASRVLFLAILSPAMAQ